MRFVKMHGIGNDYIYLDAVNEPALAERADLPELSQRMSDRHRGVGSDGLILVCRPAATGADVRMRMFNADGSESEMCGNGVRCVAKFAHDRLGIRCNPMRIETGRGMLSIEYSLVQGRLDQATVDMGEPILEVEQIPVHASRVVPCDGSAPHAYRISLPGITWEATFVSMGNPHAVIFRRGGEDLTRDQLRSLDLERLGPPIEHHPAFPRRVNAHFVSIQSRGEASMRTWERGSGITQACGTGACAVLVAGVLTGRLDREATLHLPGGDLRVRWDEATGRVFMTGPATDVFEGEWPE